LVCFPVLAHADSSEFEYQDAPPTVTGGKAPNDHGPSAGSSNAENGGASAPGGNGGSGGSSGGGSSEGGSSGSGGGAGSAKDGGGTGQQGSPGKHSGNGSIAPGKAAGGGTHEASSQDSGGSSPLVPILVAVAALAAISLGVVTIRQRRRRGPPRSHVSPEAS